MVTVQAYSDMISALGIFYKDLLSVNGTLQNQLKEMQMAMNDDYADELCGKVEKFTGRINLFLDDIIEVQRALDERMQDIFG